MALMSKNRSKVAVSTAVNISFEHPRSHACVLH